MLSNQGTQHADVTIFSTTFLPAPTQIQDASTQNIRLKVQNMPRSESLGSAQPFSYYLFFSDEQNSPRSWPPTTAELELVCKTLREPIPQGDPHVLKLSDITEFDQAAHSRAKHSRHRRDAVGPRVRGVRGGVASRAFTRRLRLIRRRSSQMVTDNNDQATGPPSEQSGADDNRILNPVSVA
jgi:hypothetical protein